MLEENEGMRFLSGGDGSVDDSNLLWGVPTVRETEVLTCSALAVDPVALGRSDGFDDDPTRRNFNTARRGLR